MILKSLGPFDTYGLSKLLHDLVVLVVIRVDVLVEALVLVQALLQLLEDVVRPSQLVDSPILSLGVPSLSPQLLDLLVLLAQLLREELALGLQGVDLQPDA